MKRNLVYIHGFASNSQANSAIIKYCHENNIKYWAIDLPCHGINALDFHTRLSIDSFAQIVFNFIVENKIKKPIIMGHSMGGAIAIILASMLPKDEIECLILLAPLNRSIRNFHIKEWKDTYNTYFKSISSDLKEKLNSWDKKTIMKLTLLAKNLVSNKTLEMIDFFYKQNKVKTLILIGEEDVVIPEYESLTYLKLNANDHSEIKLIKKAGHSLYKDNEKDFIKEVDKFLKKS